jgi:hypothetical protein
MHVAVTPGTIVSTRQRNSEKSLSTFNKAVAEPERLQALNGQLVTLLCLYPDSFCFLVCLTLGLEDGGYMFLEDVCLPSAEYTAFCARIYK